MKLNEVGRKPRPVELRPKKTEEEIKEIKKGKLNRLPPEEDLDYKNLNSTTDIKKYLEENSEE